MATRLLGISLLAVITCAVNFPDPKDRSVFENYPSSTGFRLSATLGDNMVLQRAPASALVWGFAAQGVSVTTTFNGQKYNSVAGADGIWRVNLLPTEAGGPCTIAFEASTGETTALTNVLFGDVYVCGGQSNMQFAVPGNENADAYIKEADSYPNIRLFTVGQGTSSPTPLNDLVTIEQHWEVASSKSVKGTGDGFGYFSAVCWFFGKSLFNGLQGKVPLGLISSNWGGTKDEQWMPAETSLQCGHASTGELYNAMIAPYAVGPMAVTGFTWYQGEADVTGDSSKPFPNLNYTCTQSAMIQKWRQDFKVPRAFFGAVQLSTWCPGANGNMLLAEMRDQQFQSGDGLPSFALVTAADYGLGCNIHPHFKQYPGARLANAALSMVYNKPINWRSPTYAFSHQTGPGELTVWLNDVGAAGLVLKDPANAKTAGDCSALNKKDALTCAWAELQYDDGTGLSWVNATVSLGTDKMTMVLKAKPPEGSTAIIASSYGWGAIPMMTVYRADMEKEDGQLPVLTWNRPVQTGSIVSQQTAFVV